MSKCGHVPPTEAGPGHTHSCVGEAGHPGRHWCLLGHTWPADESEETA